MTNTHNIPLYKEVYDKHMNLKIAAQELGMKWQTLYWHLSREGHPVLGDKKRYGSDIDKLAEYTEDLFQNLFPEANNNNGDKFQSKYDFTLGDYKIDINNRGFTMNFLLQEISNQDLTKVFTEV